MPGTITIKGGINSVIQNDANDNLIVTTNDATKQIYFQGTSSADAPMVIDENGKTIFQDTGSGQAVSLAVSETAFGGYQLSFTSGSTELNAIKLIQDTSGSGAGQKRALISLSGSKSAKIVSPAYALCPSVTFIKMGFGSQTSTRLPKRIIPNCSPAMSLLFSST